MVEFSVVEAGAVTTRPEPMEPTVTTIVELPVRAVTGFTTTFADAPGPVVVLQVRVTELGVAVSTLTANAGVVEATKANSAHRADRLAWSDSDFISKILFENDLRRMCLRP